MFTKSSLACHDLALFLVYDDIVPSEQDVSPFSLLYNTQTESPGSPGLSVVLKRNLVFTKSSRQSHEIAAFILYDVIVAKLQHVSPISPSPFTTHTQAEGPDILSGPSVVYLPLLLVRPSGAAF